MEQSISVMVTGAIIAGGVAGLVSVGSAIATVSFLRQSFSEFKSDTASAFRELWKKEGEQDARLNTVDRKHEGLEREHSVLPKEQRVHRGGEPP